MAMELKWMECEVTKGLFSTEYTVLVKDPNNMDNIYGEIFVYNKLVKPKEEGEIPEDHWVPGRVQVYAGREENGKVTILLPVATMNNGRYMQVPKEWLSD